MESIRSALADYIAVLGESASSTHRAEDRGRYQAHLATAALMFAAMEKDRSIERVKQLVSSERHSYGWGYLIGSAGDAAEQAFDTFASLVESAT